MKKFYTIPEMRILEFKTQDVMHFSDVFDGNNQGSSNEEGTIIKPFEFQGNTSKNSIFNPFE